MSFAFLENSNDKSLANDERFKRMYEVRCQLDSLEEQQYRQKQIECRLTESSDEAFHKVCRL